MTTSVHVLENVEVLRVSGNEIELRITPEQLASLAEEAVSAGGPEPDAVHYGDSASIAIRRFSREKVAQYDSSGELVQAPELKPGQRVHASIYVHVNVDADTREKTVELTTRVLLVLDPAPERDLV